MSDIPIGAVRNLIEGAGATYVTVDMLPGEERICAAVANWKNITGGLLILTNFRLVFTPWNVSDVVQLLSWVLPKAGAPDAAAAAVKKAGELVGGVRVSGTIASARAGKNAALLHPPTLIVTDSGGEQLEFGILHSKGTPNFDKKNEAARDAFIAAINASR